VLIGWEARSGDRTPATLPDETTRQIHSASAGIDGVVVPALHGARLLSNDLDKIKNTPEVVERLIEEVNSISAKLGLLKDIGEPMWTS
jgi:hypothetical protein